MSAKPETTFRHRVRRDLTNLSRRYPIYSDPISQKSICGSPDFYLCISGRFIGLELKAEDGKTSRIQEVKLQGIGRSGGLAIVAKPSNWMTVLELLTDLAKEKNDNDKDVVPRCNDPRLS